MTDRLPSYSERELARQVAEMRREIDELKQNARASQLGNSSIEDGYLLINDGSGVPRFIVGKQPDGKFGWGAVNGEPPPRPDTPTLIASMSGIVVRWNGTFNDIKPSDFTYVNVHVSSVGPSFIADESNLVGQLFGAGDMPVGPLDTTQQYWARLIAYNASNVPSDPSFTAGPITPAQVVAQAVLDGIIDQVALAENAVGNAQLQVDAVDGTKIAENSIETPHLTARSVSAEIIAVATILAENIAAGQIDAEHIRALAIQADHIAANQINAGHIETGSITADKLAAILILASKIVAGDPDGWRLELGDADTPILYWNGEETGFAVSRDAITGQSNVYMSGRVEFGNGSQIEQDYVDLAKRPSTGFQEPKPRQQRTWVDSGPSNSVTARWPFSTQKGSLCLMAIFQTAPSGSVAPNCGIPAGATIIDSRVVGVTRLTLLMVQNSPTSRTTETFTSGTAAARWAIALAEYTGISASAFDVQAWNSGSTALASSGATPTTTQSAELQFAVFGAPFIGFSNGKGGQWTNPTNGFVKSLEGDGTAGQGIVTFTKSADTTGPASMSVTANRPVAWTGIIATFRRAPADGVPPTPDTSTSRIFTLDRGGKSTPHVLDDSGAMYPLGRVPHCAVRLTADSPILTGGVDTFAQGNWVPIRDPFAMASIGGPGVNSTITIPFTGIYLVNYRPIFQRSTGTAEIVGFVTRNSATSGASITRTSGNARDSNDLSPILATRVVQLNAGDIIYWGTWAAVNYIVRASAHGVPSEISIQYLSPV